MSAHVEVIATDLRRAKVKVTPATFLVDVRNEACRKLNLPSEKYILKHKQRQLQLSEPFRTANLSAGAKLELVVKSSSPTVIDVALQFNDANATQIPGGRLTGKFSSEATLWKILRQFESGGASGGHNLNITGRGTAQTSSGTESGSGQMYYEAPSLNIMGREYSTTEDLQKTLSQCGINAGRVLIRVDFKKTTKTLYEAMEAISQYMKEVDPEATGEVTAAQKDQPSAAPSSGSATATTEAVPPTSQPEPAAATTTASAGVPAQQDTTTPSSVTATSSQSGPRDPLAPVSVFQAPTGDVPAAARRQDPDAVFEPSIAHMQRHQASLVASTRNKRLKSDTELAAEAAAEAARLASVTALNIKVRFPDGTSAQWTLPPDASGATLYEAVRGVMAAPQEKFRLLLPGGKGVVTDAQGAQKDQLVKGYGLRGAVLITLNWEDGVSDEVRHAAFLKDAVASRAQQVVVPEVPDDDPEEEEAGKAVKPEKSTASGSGGDGGGKKLPKWLKLGKK